MLFAIKNVSFGCFFKVQDHKDALYHILDLFDFRDIASFSALAYEFRHFIRYFHGFLSSTFSSFEKSFLNRFGNLFLIEFHHPAATLYDFCNSELRFLLRNLSDFFHLFFHCPLGFLFVFTSHNCLDLRD